MRLKVVKSNEIDFLTCVRFGLWGSNTRRVSSWLSGDSLALTVEKAIAALAELVGEYDVSGDRIGEAGAFPYRIPIKFHCAFLDSNRIPSEVK